MAPKKKPQQQQFTTVEKINFLRAYLGDLSAVRANLLNGIYPDEHTGEILANPTELVTAIDAEIGTALKNLAELRVEVVPPPVARGMLN